MEIFLYVLVIPILFSAALISTIIYIKLRQQILLIPIFLAVGALVLWYLFPVEELLAGFTGYMKDASFIVRYGPQISFYGLIIGIVGIFVPYILLLLEQTQR